MKKMISLVMAGILMMSLCACVSEPTLVGSTPTKGNPPTESDEISSTETPTVETNKVFKPGDSVELDDVVVTFIGVTESKGSTYNKPTKGNIFALCEFEIVNNSNEEISISSMLSFEAYCDDYACEYSLSALMEKGNKDQLDGTVAAGKKMKGIVGYEIPKDWKELEIQYTLDVWNDNKIVFVATNA